MKKIAFLFPGQGAQYVGMGKDFHDHFDLARQTFEKADQALGLSLSKLCFEGPEDKLLLTENTQPAILTTSLALLRVLKAQGLACDYTAGLSLGEYSALVNAGSLDFSQAVPLVRNRGLYMQEAVPEGVGGMGAIIGLPASQVEEIVVEAADTGIVEIANYNSQEQTVVSGEKKAVRRALKLAREKGAKRALPLLVSAPFHSSLLEAAGQLLEKDLDRIALADPAITFISNVSARPVKEGAGIKKHLIEQVSHPVRWYQSMTFLLDEGVRYFIEIGPGTSLGNFAKSIAAHRGLEITSISLSDREGLIEVQEALA